MTARVRRTRIKADPIPCPCGCGNKTYPVTLPLPTLDPGLLESLDARERIKMLSVGNPEQAKIADWMEQAFEQGYDEADAGSEEKTEQQIDNIRAALRVISSRMLTILQVRDGDTAAAAKRRFGLAFIKLQEQIENLAEARLDAEGLLEALRHQDAP